MQCWYSFFLARSSLTRSPRTSTALYPLFEYLRMDVPLLKLALAFVLTYVPLLAVAVCVTFMLVRMMPAGDRQQVQFESGFTFTTPLIEEERRGPAKRQRKQRVVPKMGEHSTGTRASITNFFAGRRGASPAYVSTSTSWNE